LAAIERLGEMAVRGKIWRNQRYDLETTITQRPGKKYHWKKRHEGDISLKKHTADDVEKGTQKQLRYLNAKVYYDTER